MPAAQTELKFTFRNVRVVREIDRARADGMFSRKNLSWATFDLAKGRPDGPTADPNVGSVNFRPAQPPPPPSR
jgi:hypothetical protein